MSDCTRVEAIEWLNRSPPRSFPPPDGWAWCEPNDKLKPWHLFYISYEDTPGIFDQFKDIYETVREGGA